MKCTESEEEEPIKGKESQLQLSCFINQEVKYLATGLRLVSIRQNNLKGIFSVKCDTRQRGSLKHSSGFLCSVLIKTKTKWNGVIMLFLLQRLQEEITKMSPSLNRNAQYIKSVS